MASPSRSPTIVELGQTENPPYQAGFGVLGRAAEDLIVVEIEVDYLTGRVDRERCDVIAR